MQMYGNIEAFPTESCIAWAGDFWLTRGKPAVFLFLFIPLLDDADKKPRDSDHGHPGTFLDVHRKKSKSPTSEGLTSRS